MKIKIVESGYEGFTGMFGVVEFVDAVSVNEVSSAEANLLASIIKVVDAETGLETGNLASEALTRDKPVVVTQYLTQADIDAGIEETNPSVAAVATPVIVGEKTYTQEELEGVADKEGIAGLREIGDALGVKNTSIAGLIEGILAAQGTTINVPAGA